MNKPHGLPDLVICDEDHGRLAFMATVSRMGRRYPPVGAALADELDRARVVPAADVPPTVVTMGSTVRFRDEDSGRISTVTIVYPEEDHADRGLLSVLTPLGAALIGMSEGQSIRWRSAVGEWRDLTVLHVSQAPRPGPSGDDCGPPRQAE